MKKPLLIYCIAAAGFMPMMASAVSAIQASVNVAAQMIAEVGNLEQKQWDNHTINLATTWAASETPTNSCGDGQTCSSIVVDNMTGIITFIFGTPEALNINLRGALIELHPQYLDDEGTYQDYGDRDEATASTPGDSVQSSKRIAQYRCVIVLAAEAKNPFIYTPAGRRSINFIENSTVKPIGSESTPPVNLMKTWCKASDIIINPG